MTTENSLDLSRWMEKPKGVGYRRWVIVSTGLRQLFHTTIFRILLFVAWTAGVAMAAIGFLFSQTVASGGWLETLGTHLGPRFEALSSALGGMIVLYPDICIRGLFTLIFWLQSYFGLGLSLIALTLVVPRLVTRDRASNALTIYLARPLTSVDYLLGKLGLIAGLLLLLWTGPLILGWVLSMLFAPNRDFVIYSVSPLLRALLFNGIGLVALAAISLGVSALSRTSRNTVIIWIGLWLIAGALAKNPVAPDWLRHASFSYDLSQVRETIFGLDQALTDAGTTLPLLDRQFVQTLSEAAAKAKTTDFGGALGGLCVLVVFSTGIFLRRLRPE